MNKITTAFLNHAASILADTDHGLSGSRIVEICNAWAVDYDVETPHANYPFDAPNKRTALAENLAAFDPETQYEILLDLCDRFSDDSPLEIDTLRDKITEKFSGLSSSGASSRVLPKRKTQSEKRTESARQSTSLRVFLCHASDDKANVRELHSWLVDDGYQPWLDEIDLLPGQRWEIEIPKAVRASHVVLVCLSERSTTKEGYVQKEIKFALDVADEKPDDTIFIIPARLEDCDTPHRLQRLHRVDLFVDGGYEKLLAALDTRAASINRHQW